VQAARATAMIINVIFHHRILMNADSSLIEAKRNVLIERCIKIKMIDGVYGQSCVHESAF
jgi:hypothetical protein